MRALNKQELVNCTGGKAWIFAFGVSVVTFIIGIIDGYIRPLKCNS